MTDDAMRSRAARTSSTLNGSMCRNARSTQVHCYARAGAHRFRVDVRRRREILDRQPERFEERDLVGVATADRPANEQLADLADDVIGLDVAFPQGYEDVAR